MDAPPPEPAPPTIEYQSDASLRAIRRGVRVMIALTLLNTVLLGTGVFAPGISAFAKSQWASYQAARAARAQAEQDRVANAAMMAAQADAMRFALPADTLVFAEDFAAGSLPLRGTTSATSPATRRAAGDASAAGAMPTPEAVRKLPRTLEGFGQIVRDSQCYLFVHARLARPEVDARPRVDERLVLLFVRNEPSSRGDVRHLVAVVIEPAAPDRPLRYCAYSAWDVAVARNAPLRFYAGQPDAADPSRWTVDYEWGVARGKLVSWLREDELVELVVEGPLSAYVKRAN